MVIICRKVNLVRMYLSMPEAELLLCMSGLVLSKTQCDPYADLFFFILSTFRNFVPKFPAASAFPVLIFTSSTQGGQLNSLCILPPCIYVLVIDSRQKGNINVELTLIFLILRNTNPAFPVFPCVKQLFHIFCPVIYTRRLNSIFVISPWLAEEVLSSVDLEYLENI